MAGDAEFFADAFAITAFKVGLVFEVVDEGEVDFGVVEPGGVVGVAVESRVFGGEGVVELRDGSNVGVVDVGVPEGDGGLVTVW